MDRTSRSKFRDGIRLVGVVQSALRPTSPITSGENEQARSAWERERRDQIPQPENPPPRPTGPPYASYAPGSYNSNQQQAYQAPSYPQYPQAQHQPYQPPPVPQYANHQQGYGAQQQMNGGGYNGYDGSATGHTQPNQGQYPPYASQQNQSYPTGAPYNYGGSGASSTHSVLPSPTSQTQPSQGQYPPHGSQQNHSYPMGPPYNQGTPGSNSVPPSVSPFSTPGQPPLSRASTIAGYPSTSPPSTSQYCTCRGAYTPCQQCQGYSW